MDIRQRYIDHMKEAMKTNGINARELAKRSGISEASISRYLSGQMVPRVNAVSKMAEALHVDPTWLMGYEDITPDFSVETGKLAMIIECMTPSERSQVENFIKFIITNRGGNDA